MKIKDVTVKVPDNQYTRAIGNAVESVYKFYGLEPTITSGNDSKHGDGSLHYKDRALDFRFWDILEFLAARIRDRLPPFYDVVVEKDHFHIEADVKKEQEWIKNCTNTSTVSLPVSKIKSTPS